MALNGYYKDDFREKQAAIKTLLLDKKVDWDMLNLLMDGELSKFATKNKNGEYFWLSWIIDDENRINF